MIGNLKIDQRATFAGLVFLSCEAKREMGSDRQATTKDGQLKWEVQVLGAVRNQFGQLSNEVIKVGIVARENPAQGIAPFTPCELGDFEVGVMEKTKKNPDGTERIVGVTVWFRATEILLAAGANSKAA